ncbi:hypothetical protein CDO52_06675 [Nocardiopsis gilva YIM 90087]|uniref:Uncharacterized protein n=1 Tax=Nocardiopsis gilva YIM 90087 TaxID=1235441 RepID=A0A223S312_9ACTN|nr:hypothetical protein [Nocardiopsis gilva]ASU82508.1 hypothetical protein CDO52_06675 [Nocardiopsis gilva YIM 90087]
MKAALVLAQTDLDVDAITPGVLGFIIVALIGFALYLLMKSMSKKLVGVRQANFDADASQAESGTANEAGAEPGEQKS